MKKAQNLGNPVQSAYFLGKFKVHQILEFLSPTGCQPAMKFAHDLSVLSWFTTPIASRVAL